MQNDWLDNPLQPPEPELFWNTRGRAVKIHDKRKITELIQQGFVRCDEKTKEGAYNPVYDRGDMPSVEKVTPVYVKQAPKPEEYVLEVIEI